MVYLVNEIPENVAVRRWVSKSQVVKEINRKIFNNGITSLLSIEAAEYYSGLLNINIPANNPSVSGKIKLNPSDFLFGSQYFCLLTSNVYNETLPQIDIADEFVKDPGFLVYSGYYDQPLLDFLTYDYQSQVDIENCMVREKRLEHLPWKRDMGTSAIEAVTKSLKRLLDFGVVEANMENEAYFSFASISPKKILEMYNRRYYEFRLTGAPQTGLFIPACNIAGVNPNQLLLFS